MPKDVADAIDGCRILISNDYELDLIMNKTSLDKKDLIRRAGTVIVTLGENGSQVITVDGEINIPAVKPRKVEDPDRRRRCIQGRADKRTDPWQGYRRVRQDGQRMCFLCRGELRHAGLQIRP